MADVFHMSHLLRHDEQVELSRVVVSLMREKDQASAEIAVRHVLINNDGLVGWADRGEAVCRRSDDEVVRLSKHFV